MILCQLELDILSKLDFYGGNFEKWPKPHMTHIISGNIANIIPRSPLNKMVPLMEGSVCVCVGGGGMSCTETNFGPQTIVLFDMIFINNPAFIHL